MLRRPAKTTTEPPKREPFTYVHRGTTVVGELRAEGRVRVHGTVLGSVSVRGVLEVAEAGVIEGSLVTADEVKVLGRVVADVHANGKVEIWKGGHLIGDVKARALDIEEGAYFTGRSEMVGEDGKAIALPGAAVPEQSVAPATTPAARDGSGESGEPWDAEPVDTGDDLGFGAARTEE